MRKCNFFLVLKDLLSKKHFIECSGLCIKIAYAEGRVYFFNLYLTKLFLLSVYTEEQNYTEVLFVMLTYIVFTCAI